MRRVRVGGFWLAVICVGLLYMPEASAVIVTVVDPAPSGDPFLPTDTLPPNPALPGMTSSEFNLSTGYQSLFGNPSPNALPDKVGFSESPTLFVLVMTNRDAAEVVKSQTVGFVVTGDYWTVRSDLNFNPATALVFDPNDELTLSGFVIHNGILSAPGIPHDGDDASGPELKYSVTINAGNKQPHPILGFSVGNNNANAGIHPHVEHVDVINSALFAQVVPSSAGGIDFFDDITHWSGAVVGGHIEPEPASGVLLGMGLAMMAARRRKRQTRA